MTEKKPKHYFFYDVTHCNMCGDPVLHHKVKGQRMNRSQGLNPQRKNGITTSVIQCSRCGLHYSNPMPVPVDFEDHYGIPPADYWKPEYFILNDNYFSGEIGRLKELMDVKPGMKSLDIGAGIGKCMIALDRGGFDAHGFEGSSTFHRMAVEKMNISPEKLRHATFESVSYEENTFDFITFGAILEHLYNPSESIEKAMQWLKPGGVMHIEVPSSDYFISRLLNLYYRMRGTNYVTNLSPMHEPYHLFEFTLKSFLEHSRRLGSYKILFHEYYICSAEPFPRFMRSLLYWWMKRTNTGMQLTVWLQKT